MHVLNKLLDSSCASGARVLRFAWLPPNALPRIVTLLSSPHHPHAVDKGDEELVLLLSYFPFFSSLHCKTCFLLIK